MRRALSLIGMVVAAAVLAAPAAGAIFIQIVTGHVHRGGSLALTSDATAMPLYALPLSRMPCAKYGICTGPIQRRAAPTRAPFVFLARTPGHASGMTRPRAFWIRLPRALLPGKYVVFVWCAACGGSRGGSLIVAGSDPSGQPQTLDVLPELPQFVR